MRGETWSRRDLVGIRCCSVLSGVELQMIKPPNIGFPTLLASGRQIFGYLPASGSIENQTDSDTVPVTSSFVVSLDAIHSVFRWLSYCGSNHRWWSHRRWKNKVALEKEERQIEIDEKPPNLVETEEENQGRKYLVIVQSLKINLCGQWYVELLLHSQSTIAATGALC